MIIRLILPLYFVCLFNAIFAERLYSSAQELSNKTGIISGRIIDGENIALTGANVYLENTLFGSASDEKGNFEITDITIGSYLLIISMVGYETQRQKIEIKENQNLYVEIQLRETFYETGSIVVTGTTTQYLYEDSPVKIEVVPRKLIEQSKSMNLAEAIGLQTGVRIENNCQNCNFTQVRILGFDGKYSQILIDGDPVVSSLAGVYALEQYPQEMISQLEIVKGGGSALYGGGAVAGTINIITQRPQLNQAKLNFYGQNLGGSFDNQIGLLAELISKDGKTGAFVFGSARVREPYDRNNDGFSELGKLSNETIGFNWFFKPSIKNQINFSLYRIHEERRGGNNFHLPQHEADITEWLNHLKWGGKAKWQHNLTNKIEYNLFYSFSSLTRDSYYGGLTDLNDDGVISQNEKLAAAEQYGNAEDFTQNFGGRINFSLGNHKITGGIDYTYNKLLDRSLKIEEFHIDKLYTNTGIYLQNDISLFNSQMNIVLGARIDKHSEVFNPIISPRINLKYELSEGLNFRSSYTAGFKPPQTFDEDLHIESLSGTQRVIRNSENLVHENSRSVTLGFEYKGFVINDIALLIGVTGFFTNLNNAFALIPSSDTKEDLIIWERINSGSAQVKGIEIDFGFKPIAKIELRAGFTYKEGKYDSQQEIFEDQFSDKFLRTPNTFGYFRLSFDPTNRINLFSSIRFTGSMFVPNEAKEVIVETKETFWELDLGVSYRIPLFDYFGGKLNLGVKNLFDSYQSDIGTGPNRDPAYVYGPQLPQRFYAGIEIAF